MHGILYLTVYDEDKNHKSEFLGKIAVPLLKMEVRIQIQRVSNEGRERYNVSRLLLIRLK